jgi:hypothetical protein
MRSSRSTASPRRARRSGRPTTRLIADRMGRPMHGPNSNLLVGPTRLTTIPPPSNLRGLGSRLLQSPGLPVGVRQRR